MGMFDWVNYECECPVCKAKVKGFQSKDADCQCETIEPQTVDRFYAFCEQCDCWIEFTRIVIKTNEFTRIVHSDDNKPMDEHTAKLTIA